MLGVCFSWSYWRPSILEQVMACWRQATRHYLVHCWPKFMTHMASISHIEMKWINMQTRMIMSISDRRRLDMMCIALQKRWHDVRYSYPCSADKLFSSLFLKTFVIIAQTQIQIHSAWRHKYEATKPAYHLLGMDYRAYSIKNTAQNTI